jgi:hypothetical protein
MGLLIWVLIFFIGATAQATLGATLTVCPSGCDHTSIQDAVSAAMPGDTIMIDVTGTVTEGGIFINKNLTILGRSALATVVQAAPIVGLAGTRVFDIHRATVTFRALTIRHGRSRVGSGGGVLNFRGTITFSDCHVKDNAAFRGGGIANFEGKLFLRDGTLVLNNTAERHGNGGGIYNDKGELSIQGSTLVKNSANFSDGGGIYNTRGGKVLIQLGSTLMDNTANRSGGGIYNDNGEVFVSESFFMTNTAGRRGGGIYNNKGEISIITSDFDMNTTVIDGGGLYNFMGEAFIADSTFHANQAFFGGGISTKDRELVIRRSTFSENKAFGQGGGIFNGAGEVDIANSTFSENTAAIRGGGIAVGGGTTTAVNSTFALHDPSGIDNFGGQVTVSNSIVAVNVTDCVGGVATKGPNLASDGTCAGFSIPMGNAKLGSLQNNGGPTDTHALLASSDAIDEGDNDICDAIPVLAEDQRGVPRPQPAGGDCDLGAFETTGTQVALLPVVHPQTAELQVGATQSFAAYACPSTDGQTPDFGLDGQPGTDDDNCSLENNTSWTLEGVGVLSAASGPTTEYIATFPGSAIIFASVGSFGDAFAIVGVLP